MRKQSLLMCLLAATLGWTATGCSDETVGATNPSDPNEGRIKVTATAGMPQGGASTRVDFNENGSTLEITWKNDIASNPETFSVLQGVATAAPSTFTQTLVNNENAHQASFEGSLASTDGTFYALYPALPEGAASAQSITLDMTQQTGTAPDEKKTYMYGTSTYDESTGLAFSFHHLTTLLKLKLKLPDTSEKTLTNVKLMGTNLFTNAKLDLTLLAGTETTFTYTSPAGGKIDLSGSFTTNTEGAVTVYLHLLPGELNNLCISATCNDVTYAGTVLDKNYKLVAGQMYTADVELKQPLEFSDAIANGAGTEPTLLDSSKPNAEDNPYLIASPENLRWLVKQTEGDNPIYGKFYKLTTDIKVTAATWTPIGNETNMFTGNFDGGGHVISGELKGDNQEFGFFGQTYAEYDNPTPAGNISNLHMAATIRPTNKDYVFAGSVVGYHVGQNITGCSNSGTVYGPETTGGSKQETSNIIGGIIGSASGDIKISYCTNTGTIMGAASPAGNSLGGIVGYGWYAQITGCSNSGTVQNESNGFTGGIIGNYGSMLGRKIEACINTGSITGGTTISIAKDKGGTGGIIGGTSVSGLTVMLCTNTGDVTGSNSTDASPSYTGGIIGRVDNTLYAHLCHNSGVVTKGSSNGGGVYTGGILGGTSDNPSVHIYNCCTNTGTPLEFIGNGNDPEECKETHTAP